MQGKHATQLAIWQDLRLVARMDEELTKLRGQIDAIDDQLIGLLKERIGIVKQVGALKDSHFKRACHARPGREGRMQRRIFEAFSGTDFTPLAATAMWRQIIGASTHLESPLHVTTLEGEGNEALYWHSRAYFGFFSDVKTHGDVKSVLQALVDGKASIAVLPSALSDASWVSLLTQEPFKHLKIFAHIPFVKRKGKRMQPYAFAVADVPMEASDSDVSCFVKADGTYTETEGFVTEMPDAHYIGTYPTPVEYEED